MIWRDGECQISSNMIALARKHFMGEWLAEVRTRDGESVWADFVKDEAAAKAAVCHWIGKTMAQFSNALAAGCNDADDGN